MKHRLKRTASMACCFVAGLVVNGVAQDTRPNILFILADDQAIESITAYNTWLKDYTQTPNIDRLANEGMLFKYMCSNNSVCEPSRASIITGQYSHVHGVTGNAGSLPINPDSPWVSKKLQRNGYQTWLVGKWHLESEPEGFTDYRVVSGQGSYFDPKYIGPSGIVENVTGYSSDKYTDKALEWLDGRDRTKPFCMMLHFKAAHYPFDCAPRHENLLDGVTVVEPATLYEDLDAANSWLKPQWPKRTKFHLVQAPNGTDPDDPNVTYYNRNKDELEPHDPNDMTDRTRVAYQHLIKNYIRCVAGIDDNVGRMIEYLENEGILDQTVIIYTADQGYWIGQHGFYDKRLIYDGSLRTPFIVRYPPMVAAGIKNRDMCSNVDIAPTMLELAEINPAVKMQGRSLVPVLQGNTPADWRTAAWYNYPGKPQNYGIRTREYTLVHDHDNADIELYDNIQDKHQTVSVHNDPAYSNVLQELEIELQQAMEEADITQEELDAEGEKNGGTTGIPVVRADDVSLPSKGCAQNDAGDANLKG